MTDEEKVITPRLVALAALQQYVLSLDGWSGSVQPAMLTEMNLLFMKNIAGRQEIVDDGPVCQICFDKPPEVELQPCGHKDFCSECAQLCQRCPLCRANVLSIANYASLADTNAV